MDADGNEFSNMLIRLSISPKVVGAASSASIACRLLPYRFDSDGNIEEHGSTRPIVSGDVVAANDADLTTMFAEIGAAIQKYVTAKEL